MKAHKKSPWIAFHGMFRSGYWPLSAKHSRIWHPFAGITLWNTQIERNNLTVTNNRLVASNVKQNNMATSQHSEASISDTFCKQCLVTNTSRYIWHIYEYETTIRRGMVTYDIGFLHTCESRSSCSRVSFTQIFESGYDPISLIIGGSLYTIKHGGVATHELGGQTSYMQLVRADNEDAGTYLLRH